MITVKVIGIGSPFGDDQLGWKVIELLKQRNIMQIDTQLQLDIESYDRPGIHLLKLMSNATIVFLIDAVVTGNILGTLYRLQNEEIDELKCLLSTHEIGIAQALQLGRALNQLPKKVILYGIEIDPTNSSKSISPQIKTAIDELVVQVENEIIALGSVYNSLT